MNENLYMIRCIDLARRAGGYASPNPMVGAVLVHEDRILGEGWHHEYGKPHAEVQCLASVKREDKHLVPYSTMYVNLEPCAHTGKTPPCAVRLVKEQVKKVIIANIDPFAQVSGRGINILREAGVEVETGICAAEGLWLNRRFFCFHTQKRPYIILKWAQTADGYIAPADKNRLQVSGTAAQQLVHKWRTEEAAIMVGGQTAISDNPQLTARLWQGRQPLRIAVMGQRSMLAGHHLLDGSLPTLIFNPAEDGEQGNTCYKKLDYSKPLPQQVNDVLYERQVISVIIEGGPNLLSQFIDAGLWDEARIITGNKLLQQGIKAPHLPRHEPAFTTALGDDTLSVVIRTGSPFTYIAGMSL